MSIEIRACIDVDDLEKGIEFYTRGLGLRLGRRLGSNWAELLGASSPIDLLANPAGSLASPVSSARRDYARHWTPVHLDFVVDDLEAAVKRAEQAGARLDREIQVQKWGRMANMADPFGHGLCLLEFRGRGYDELLTSSPGP
jgi:catechol 2,3-dioxygenase-like lactoylglutathione lyase family enzyme